MDSEIKKQFNSVLLLSNNCKINFKNIFFNLGLKIFNSLKNDNDLNKSNIINTSYENINSELLNLETLIKNINNIQSQNKKKKKREIENLEDKLHEYMDEIDKMDFNKIDKIFDSYNNDKNNIDNIILQNDFVEKYNSKEFEFQNENNKEQNNNKLLNLNNLNNDNEPKNLGNKNKDLINDIVNFKENNRDNAIKYIKSLIQQSKNQK